MFREAESQLGSLGFQLSAAATADTRHVTAFYEASGWYSRVLWWNDWLICTATDQD